MVLAVAWSEEDDQEKREKEGEGVLGVCPHGWGGGLFDFRFWQALKRKAFY
jgi:hypothetical protein